MKNLESPEIDSSSCDSNPCQNNGICFDKLEKYVCFCPPGYVGENCEYTFKLKTSVCGANSPCKNGYCVPVGDR